MSCLCCRFQSHWRLWRLCHSLINNFIRKFFTYLSISIFYPRFSFLASLWIWICYCDISASLSMHICSFQQSAYICTSFIILCLFFCSAFITLLEVIKLTFNVYSIKRINLRIFQIIFYYYFYESNSISNNNFNSCLFQRVFVLFWLLMLCNAC